MTWKCPRCGSINDERPVCFVCHRPQDAPPGWEMPEQPQRSFDPDNEYTIISDRGIEKGVLEGNTIHITRKIPPNTPTTGSGHKPT